MIYSVIDYHIVGIDDVGGKRIWESPNYTYWIINHSRYYLLVIDNGFHCISPNITHLFLF